MAKLTPDFRFWSLEDLFSLFNGTFDSLLRRQQRNCVVDRPRQFIGVHKAVGRVGGWPRVGASMVRQSGHDGMVDASLAQRGIRLLDRVSLRGFLHSRF